MIEHTVLTNLSDKQLNRCVEITKNGEEICKRCHGTMIEPHGLGGAECVGTMICICLFAAFWLGAGIVASHYL